MWTLVMPCQVSSPTTSITSWTSNMILLSQSNGESGSFHYMPDHPTKVSFDDKIWNKPIDIPLLIKCVDFEGHLRSWYYNTDHKIPMEINGPNFDVPIFLHGNLNGRGPRGIRHQKRWQKQRWLKWGVSGIWTMMLMMTQVIVSKVKMMSLLISLQLIV